MAQEKKFLQFVKRNHDTGALSVYVHIFVERTLSSHFPALFLPVNSGLDPDFAQTYSLSSPSSSSLLKVPNLRP